MTFLGTLWAHKSYGNASTVGDRSFYIGAQHISFNPEGSSSQEAFSSWWKASQLLESIHHVRSSWHPEKALARLKSLNSYLLVELAE